MRRVYPELAEALSAAERVSERAQGRRLKKKCFFGHFFVDIVWIYVKILVC